MAGWKKKAEELQGRVRRMHDSTEVQRLREEVTESARAHSYFSEFQLVQVAIWASPGCTSCGCANLAPIY